MALDKIPSLLDWQVYSSLAKTLRPSEQKREQRERAQDPALEVIDSALAAYHTLTDTAQLDALFHLYLACDFWVRKAGRSVPTGRLKQTPQGNVADSGLRIAGADPGRAEVVQDLKDICHKTLMPLLRTLSTRKDLVLSDAALLNEQFALRAKQAEAEKDLQLVMKGWQKNKTLIEYLEQEKDRRTLKLSFRKGVAFRWSYAKGLDGSGTEQKSVLEVYDTIKNQDVDTRGGETDSGLFVMAPSGRIYTGSVTKDKDIRTVHTGFLAGEPVFCAGTISIQNGIVKAISGASGHYGPSARHMLTVLQRLRLYGVDLADVQVRRTNEFIHKGVKTVETCNAISYLQQSGWPIGEARHKQVLYVGKAG